MIETKEFALTGEDKKSQGQELFENLTNPNDEKGVWIDNGMVSLVKTLNSETSISTHECCSGLFKDHYDIKNMKKELSFDEFVTENSVPYTLFHYVSTEAFLHKFEADGRVVLENPSLYHSNLRSTSTQPINIDNYESRVDEAESREERENLVNQAIRVGWNIDFVPSIRRYSISVDPISNYQVFNHAESYQEYDEKMRSAINCLENSIVNVSSKNSELDE